MEPYFSEENLQELYAGYNKIDYQKNDLLLKFSQYPFKNEKAKEFALHGLMRRLGVLNTAIHNIYECCSPEQCAPLEISEANKIVINLQSFMINVYGCLDNIAWIWVHENEINIPNREVGLTSSNKTMRSYFSDDFQSRLIEFDPWCREYLKNYRDALAHRIPLYVPPVSFTDNDQKTYDELEKKKWAALKEGKLDVCDRIAEAQKKIGRFYPWMQHSYSEKSKPVVFHAQILADWSTIIELSSGFYFELSNSTQTTHPE